MVAGKELEREMKNFTASKNLPDYARKTECSDGEEYIAMSDQEMQAILDQLSRDERARFFEQLSSLTQNPSSVESPLATGSSTT